MQSRTIRIADVERLQNILAAVPEHRAVEVTTVQAVRMLTPQIHAMRAKGYGLRAVAELLTENGVRVTTATLKTYLRRANGGRKSGKSKSPRRPGRAPVETVPKTGSKPGLVIPGGGVREVTQVAGVMAMGAVAATAPMTPPATMPLTPAATTQLGLAATTPATPAATTPDRTGTPTATHPGEETQRRPTVVPKEDTRDL